MKTKTKAAQELATLLRAADSGRTPEDAATLDLALDRYLDVTDLAVSTRLTHDRGPFTGPAEAEPGHAGGCARLAEAEVAWDAQWEAGE